MSPSQNGCESPPFQRRKRKKKVEKPVDRGLEAPRKLVLEKNRRVISASQRKIQLFCVNHEKASKAAEETVTPEFLIFKRG